MEKFVRTFSLLIITLTYLFGQSFEIQTLDSILFEEGEFGGQLFLSATHEPELRVENKYIDEIIAKSLHIDKNVMQRIFDPLLTSNSFQRSDQVLKNIRSRYPFIPKNTKIEYGLLEDDQLGALVNYRPEFNSHFSGLAGVGKVDDGGWETGGELHVHLENIWGTATITDIVWKKTEFKEQYVSISHDDPFPFGLPFGYKIKLVQDLQDRLFVHYISRGAISAQLSKSGIWYFGGSKESLFPVESDDSLSIESFRSESIFAEYFSDTRNDRWMPTKGSTMDMTIECGSIKTEDKELSLGVDVKWIQYFQLKPLFSVKITHLDQGIWMDGKGTVHQGKMIQYGGHTTLRGYRENMFQAQAVSITGLDLLYTPSKAIHFYTFYDISENYEHTSAQSYGAGIRQKTQNTLIDISFAWPVDESFSEGKVHIKFTSLLE